MAKSQKAPPAATPGGIKLRKKSFVGLKKDQTRPILVELPGGPKVVVDATSTDDAWEKYKAIAGVNASDHKPVFRRPGPDCLVNEHGVVVNEHGLQQLAELKQPDNGKGNWNLDEEELDD